MKTADDILREMGFYHPMPRPYIHDNVKEAMERYAQERITLLDEKDAPCRHADTYFVSGVFGGTWCKICDTKID